MLTLFWGAWSKHAENKRSATYLAARLAVILERFAIECADVVTDQEDFERAGQGRASVHCRGLSLSPPKQGWNTLDSALLSRVLTFPNTLRLHKLALDSLWNVSPSDFSKECSRDSGKLGSMAWALSRDLRARYRLQPFDASLITWDFVKILEAHKSPPK
jgi:hypothetical protein